MRWRLVVGFGFVGVVAGSAFGQFAVDRIPQTPPAMPAGMPPGTPQGAGNPGVPPTATYSPGAYTPPASGVVPAGGSIGTTSPGMASSYPTLASIPGAGGQTPRLSAPPKLEIDSVLGPNHPWALKAEHGPYFICVKSYSRPHTPTAEDNGPSARELAEKLAGEIRTLHNVQAFLYEYVSEERKAEAAALAAQREKGRVFAEQLEERKKQAELQGMEFLQADNKIRYKTVNYRDQIAVLVGGFQTDEAARKALDEMRTWPSPKDKILMDGVATSRPTGDGTGKVRIENGYMNPYKSATVAPNPLIPHPTQHVSSRLEPFIVKLNEGCPYNLLKATHEWTLVVKSFTPPVEIVSKEVDPSLMKKNSSSKGGNALIAGAAQAEALAKLLREMKGPGGQPLGLEAFVLHTRNASIVTIGQFDGPNDPAMQQTQNLLASMKMSVTQDKMGSRPVGNAPSLLDDRIYPIAIPRP